ncbi:MAG: hypothetical protein PHI66_01985 [Candidatus Pacebacteria bacterium]|nr:hypothetical protein [Candidatus Paceibacterota bacterium]
MNNNDYFNDFFKESRYNDDFGYNPIWNKEVNKWLELVHKINEKYYEIGKTDIKTREKRDAFLGEIKSIYYCHKVLKGENFRIGIKELIDFEYQKNGQKFFVEVKSPSWQGEILKDDKLSKEQKLIRKNKKQYINGEGGWFSAKAAIEDSIKNSIHKFKKSEHNILMIVPNMFAQIQGLQPWHIQIIIDEELKKQDKDYLISTIAILETELSESNRKKKIEYPYSEYQRTAEHLK